MNHGYHQLPEVCYATNPADGAIVIVKRGEVGYWPAGMTPEAKASKNNVLHVSPAIEEAMKAGSMFGFDKPAADPASYTIVQIVTAGGGRWEGDLLMLLDALPGPPDAQHKLKLRELVNGGKQELPTRPGRGSSAPVTHGGTVRVVDHKQATRGTRNALAKILAAAPEETG